MIEGIHIPRAYVRLDYPPGCTAEGMLRAAHVTAKRLGMGVSCILWDVVVMIDPWQTLEAVIEGARTVEEQLHAETAKTTQRRRPTRQPEFNAPDGHAQAGDVEAPYPAWATPTP